MEREIYRKKETKGKRESGGEGGREKEREG